MADEVGCRMRSPCVVQGLSISSKFLQRVGRMSLIDHSITVSAEWYQKMKKATPSMIQTVIDSVEATTLLILARLVSLVLAFPLPFSSADAIACGGLDILELLAGYKNRIVGYLRRVFSREEMSKAQGAYLNMLIRFENEIRNMAVGEIRTTVQAFLDIQIGLFDRLDDAIESFYKKWPHSGSSNPGSEESEPGLSDESSFLFRRVTQTFQEVMEQRNLLTWVQGGPSPLEPVWQYLHTLANSLNPDEVSLREFSEQIYFMRIALRTSVQQIKQVSRSAKTSFIGAQLKSVFGTFFPALTWPADFAFKKLTACKIINRMWKAPEAEQNEGIEDTSREIEDTSASNEDPESTIIITVQCETPREGRQRISGNGAPMIDESIGCLGIVEEASTEGDDSSDQHSPSGHDNSAEIEISDNANPRKSSRAARRRRKKSLN